MKENLKLILAISASLIISLFFLGVGLWANHAKAEFQTALTQSQSSNSVPDTVAQPAGSQIMDIGARIIFSIVGAIALVLIIGLVAVGYFLPTIIARKRKHRNLLPIFIINLCFTPLGVGWIVALVWACLNEPAPVVVQKI